MVSGNTSSATDNNSITGCPGLAMPGPDLVYKFTVFPGNDLTFTLAPELNGQYDPGIYILPEISPGSCAAVGGCIARADAAPSGQPETIHVSGLTAGIAAFLGASFYGSASSGDAQGYELYVIASAVVGGASLIGGRGSAVGAMLGALLIVLIRQSIRTLHFDQNYEWIVIGCAIIIAVVLDQGSARVAARRLAAAPAGGNR